MFGFGRKRSGSESTPVAMEVDRAIEKCYGDDDITELCNEILALEAWNRADSATGDDLAMSALHNRLKDHLKKKGIVLATEEDLMILVNALGQ